jgi:hypothetical protein
MPDESAKPDRLFFTKEKCGLLPVVNKHNLTKNYQPFIQK